MNLFKLLKLGLAFALSVMIVNLAYAIAGNGHLRKDRMASFSYDVKPWYKYHKDGTAGREIVVYFSGKKPKQKIQAILTCEGKTSEFSNTSSAQTTDSISLLLPALTGLKATTAHLSLAIGDEKFSETLIIPAKKQWTVYIYPHSHVDIGYTNLQDVVEKLHVRNIDVGIDIANKTKDYPTGAKFIWNPEATWVVDSYLEQADAQHKASFIDAVKKGWIQIDGAHSNLNTSTCSDEELLRMFKNSKEIESLTGVPITTMVQMDNPGASWGMVQAAAQNGIKGFFSFPNYFDLRHRWENSPFYWEAQDGESKIFYLQATSYGYGFKAKGSVYGLGKIQALTDKYDRLSTNEPLNNFIDPFIFEETEKLERLNSPYDIFAMTWSMADNCLIDADLPEAVKLWNQKYAYPKLIIAGTKEILAAYEQKYKTIIPTYRGDISEFWTQGLGADAKSVGLGRKGKEDLVQAETLWPMLNGTKPAPIAQFNEAWENLLLSAEHTWGYQDPRAPLAKTVEANKAAYFSNAEKEAKALLTLAVQPIQQDGSKGFAAINTLSWPRDGIIVLSAMQSKVGDLVVDEQKRPVLSQRLTTGELAFEARAVPALGSKFYQILPGENKNGQSMISGHNLANESISVTIDEKNGNIKSLIDLKNKRQLVDSSSVFGLNSYNYLAGVKNGSETSPIGEITNATNISIKIKENGPLIASLLITAKAESCNWLTREVKLVKDQPYLELINTIDKIATQKKEGIHYGFAFNIPNGEIKMDIPLGIITPETDQLPYTNKNWFTFQRWIDISNNDYGITWTAIEAPIVEIGKITGTVLDGARLSREWIRKVQKSQTLLSWPINNHWDTNFPLQQGGIISNRYMILPHKGPYEAVIANRFGVEQHRPLIAVQTNRNPINKPLLQINNPKIMISTMKKSENNTRVIIRLRSISSQTEKLKLSWMQKTPKSVYTCLPNEKPLIKLNGEISMLPYSTSSYSVEF